MSRNIMQVFHWNKMSVKPPTKSGPILFSVFYCPDRVYSGYFNLLIGKKIFIQSPLPGDLNVINLSDILYWADAPVAPQED